MAEPQQGPGMSSNQCQAHRGEEQAPTSQKPPTGMGDGPPSSCKEFRHLLQHQAQLNVDRVRIGQSYAYQLVESGATYAYAYLWIHHHSEDQETITKKSKVKIQGTHCKGTWCTARMVQVTIQEVQTQFKAPEEVASLEGLQQDLTDSTVMHSRYHMVAQMQHYNELGQAEHAHDRKGLAEDTRSAGKTDDKQLHPDSEDKVMGSTPQQDKLQQTNLKKSTERRWGRPIKLSKWADTDVCQGALMEGHTILLTTYAQNHQEYLDIPFTSQVPQGAAWIYQEAYRRQLWVATLEESGHQASTPDNAKEKHPSQTHGLGRNAELETHTTSM